LERFHNSHALRGAAKGAFFLMKRHLRAVASGTAIVEPL